MRHAKSDHGNSMIPDEKRPLNQRGEKDAREMAERLLKKNIIPQQIVSSNAIRAIRTAEYFADILGYDRSGIIEDEEIYETLTYNLMYLVNDLDDGIDFVALFGHNPSITGLVNLLCDTSHISLPTCGMALISFPFDRWEMVSPGTGELVLYDYPKSTE